MEIEEVGQMKQKIRYEKPVSMPLGAVAPIAGASCSFGVNPTVGPTCVNTGSDATFYCNQGVTTTTGICESGGTAKRGECSTGGEPLK